MPKSLTVGELRTLLATHRDELPVYIDMFWEDDNGDIERVEPDDCHVIRSVEQASESSISNEYVALVAGKGFGW